MLKVKENKREEIYQRLRSVFIPNQEQRLNLQDQD